MRLESGGHRCIHIFDYALRPPAMYQLLGRLQRDSETPKVLSLGSRNSQL